MTARPATNQYFFSAVGGSGSTYLVRNLAKCYDEVGNKPDNAFRPRYRELWSGRFNIDQGTFEDRAGGCFLTSGTTLEDVLPEYIEYLVQDPCRTVVFGTAAELGYLSMLRVPKVVFLVRHPLHAFASWAKPERHGDVIKHLGGINHPDAIGFFARRWRRATDEIFRLDDAGLLGGVIRYERAHDDAEPLGLSIVFESFDATKRNHDFVDFEARALFQSIIGGSYERLYGEKWHDSLDILESSD